MISGWLQSWGTKVFKLNNLNTSHQSVKTYYRPRGKESTEVRITQNKGKLLPKIEENHHRKGIRKLN